MGVADDDVFDVGRIELELLEAVLDVVLDLVAIVERLDEDDAFRGLHRPRTRPVIADKIELVHHLHRFQRRLFDQRAVFIDGAAGRIGGCVFAEGQRPQQIRFRGPCRGGDVPIDNGVVLLRDGVGDDEGQGQSGQRNRKISCHGNTPDEIKAANIRTCRPGVIHACPPMLRRRGSAVASLRRYRDPRGTGRASAAPGDRKTRTTPNRPRPHA